MSAEPREVDAGDAASAASTQRQLADAQTIVEGSSVVRMGMHMQTIATQLGALSQQLIADEVANGWEVHDKPDVVRAIVLAARLDATITPDVAQLLSDLVTQAVPALDTILNQQALEQAENDKVLPSDAVCGR